MPDPRRTAGPLKRGWWALLERRERKSHRGRFAQAAAEVEAHARARSGASIPGQPTPPWVTPTAGTPPQPATGQTRPQTGPAAPSPQASVTPTAPQSSSGGGWSTNPTTPSWAHSTTPNGNPSGDVAPALPAGGSDDTDTSKQRRRRDDEPTRRLNVTHARRLSAAGVVVTALAAITAVLRGLPLLTDQYDWAALGSTGALAGVLGWFTHDLNVRYQLPRRRLVKQSAAALAVVLLVTLGASQTLVIDGQPYLSTSETARVYRYSHDTLDVLFEIRDLDALLKLDEPAARARFNEFSTANRRLNDISRRYQQLAENGEPTEPFVAVSERVAAAAFFGAEAMQQRSDLLVRTDARLAADLAETQLSFVETVQAAASELEQAARLYGVDDLAARAEDEYVE